MIRIGLIKEGKQPADNRVALTPTQCRWIKRHFPQVDIRVEHSPDRCFEDQEFEKAGIQVAGSVADCDILMGIKEVPIDLLIPDKTYLFFSHTKKKQPHNQKLMKAMIEKNITLSFHSNCSTGWSFDLLSVMSYLLRAYMKEYMPTMI